MSQKEKFDIWMRKIGNVFYADNKRMELAFSKILE